MLMVHITRWKEWNERWLWIQWRGYVLHLELIWGTPINFAFLRYAVSLSGESHGQRNLGYSPWGHKESDTTERLTLWWDQKWANWETVLIFQFTGFFTLTPGLEMCRLKLWHQFHSLISCVRFSPRGATSLGFSAITYKRQELEWTKGFPAKQS